MWDTLHRPLKFGDVLGQQGTVQLLKARLSKGSALGVSYIFAGGHGQGKTTLARILARAMLCQNLDKADPEPCNECENCLDVLNGQPGAYVEQDAASGGTIDNIRSLVEDLPFALFNAPKRVYVFDEAHRMSREAQDVLLKPLEEKKMVGIFCTTEPEKIRGPIRSRCEEYAIRKITREDVLVRMNMILDHHGVEHEDDAVLTVIDYSGGHVRDVVNRLEMIAQMGRVDLAAVREYLHLSVVSTYYEVLLSLGDPKRAIDLVEGLCERISPEEISAGLAEAAMNAFRLRYGMFADLVYVDRSLGEQLYSTYGDAVVRLAEYFLRQRYTSKVGLICDLLNLRGGVPVTAPVATPVLIQAAAPAISAVTLLTPSAHLPVSSPVAPPVAIYSESLLKASATGKGVLRPDGVGSLGSGDAAALTSHDHQAVPRQMPRGRNLAPQPINFNGVDEGDETMVIPADQWRREFERTWLDRG